MELETYQPTLDVLNELHFEWKSGTNGFAFASPEGSAERCLVIGTSMTPSITRWGSCTRFYKSGDNSRSIRVDVVESGVLDYLTKIENTAKAACRLKYTHFQDDMWSHSLSLSDDMRWELACKLRMSRKSPSRVISTENIMLPSMENSCLVKDGWVEPGSVLTCALHIGSIWSNNGKFGISFVIDRVVFQKPCDEEILADVFSQM